MQTLRRSGPSRYLRRTASSSSSSISETSTRYTLSRDASQSDSSLSLGDSWGETSKDTTKTRSRHARPSPRTVNERPRTFRSGLSSADVGMVSPDIAYLISVTKVIKGKVQSGGTEVFAVPHGSESSSEGSEEDECSEASSFRSLVSNEPKSSSYIRLDSTESLRTHYALSGLQCAIPDRGILFSVEANPEQAARYRTRTLATATSIARKPVPGRDLKAGSTSKPHKWLGNARTWLRRCTPSVDFTNLRRRRFSSRHRPSRFTAFTRGKASSCMDGSVPSIDPSLQATQLQDWLKQAEQRQRLGALDAGSACSP